jgi:hypothetical protein
VATLLAVSAATMSDAVLLGLEKRGRTALADSLAFYGLSAEAERITGRRA